MPVDRARDFDIGKSPDHGRPEEHEMPVLTFADEGWPDPEPPFAVCPECGVFFYGEPGMCSDCQEPLGG